LIAIDSGLICLIRLNQPRIWEVIGLGHSLALEKKKSTHPAHRTCATGKGFEIEHSITTFGQNHHPVTIIETLTWAMEIMAKSHQLWGINGFMGLLWFNIGEHYGRFL